MEIDWSQITFREKLSVIGRELGEMVVKVEGPEIQVGLI